MYLMGREEYKQRIDSSPLFSLSRDEEPALYRRETLKMAENVFGYLLCIDEERYKYYGKEIIETVQRCIKYYDESKGDFLNYFLSAWQVQFAREKAKEAEDNRLGGMHISEEDRRNIRKIVKYAKTNGKDYLSEEFAQTVSEVTGIDIGDVEELIDIILTKVVSDEKTNIDGDTFSLVDLVTASNDKTVEERLDDESRAKDVLKRLDKYFLSRQDRQKPILSAIIMTKIVKPISESESLKKAAQSCSFFDGNILSEFLTSGKELTQREIAERFDVEATHVSRSWRRFIDQFTNLQRENVNLINYLSD